MQANPADVCLVLEGTYPYVSGGVSNWAHELIKAQKDLSFALVCILPPDDKLKMRFDVPSNVISIQNVFLQRLPEKQGSLSRKEKEKLFEELEVPILNLQHKATLKGLQKIISLLNDKKKYLDNETLLNSVEAWKMTQRMYLSTMGESSFLNYFWSWRCLLGSFYSALLAPIPAANVYHTLCTGYAGLFTARAFVETSKPCLVTEHGIYMNERKIEITSADWLEDYKSMNLNIEKKRFDRDLKSYWIDTFLAYSTLCYEACEKIITLYEGNLIMQIADGADPSKLTVIPNGIDVEKFSQIVRVPHEKNRIAFIGRVVSIKDVKTFIRAIGLLQDKVPHLEGLIIGPTDEDPDYYQECLDLVESQELQSIITFTGKLKIEEILPTIDLIVLTSISEAQPLVLLEAGAVGIPAVTTNVGACEEILNGKMNENPPLGVGGLVSQLANPLSVSKNILRLLLDKKFYDECSRTIRLRVHKYYDEREMQTKYKQLYESMIKPAITE
ncbi:MAG: GT4 family glycosyltransferase PelF [Parachlamydiales bacterium]|jgi:glycosyltransferase involved in cell wall biosynthesis